MTMGWCLDCHRNPGPYLRKPERCSRPTWTPPPDQNEEGRKLMARYHIDTDAPDRLFGVPPVSRLPLLSPQALSRRARCS